KAVVMRVHHIQRHLHSIKRKTMRESGLEHLVVKLGTLMTSESDVPDLASLFRIEHGFHTSAARKNTFRVGGPNHLVKLQKVDVIGLQPAQRFLQLLRRRSLSPSIDFGHQKRLLPVAITQSLPHPYFALAIVIVPAVVEKIHPVIERGAYDANLFLLIHRRRSDVISAHTNH